MWDDVFKNSALIVVDAQKGFTSACPNELPVPGALEIRPKINQLLAMPWKRIIATQDWHPANHSSFKPQGGPYPTHCVQNTPGAEFLPGLWTERFHAIYRKGYKPHQDAYSAALDHPGFSKMLEEEVKAVYLCGICTNICVFETACDVAAGKKIETFIVEDASANLDLPEDNPYCPAKIKEKAALWGIKYVKVWDVIPVL